MKQKAHSQTYLADFLSQYVLCFAQVGHLPWPLHKQKWWLGKANIRIVCLNKGSRDVLFGDKIKRQCYMLVTKQEFTLGIQHR